MMVHVFIAINVINLGTMVQSMLIIDAIIAKELGIMNMNTDII